MITGRSVLLNANLATTGGNINLSGSNIYIGGNGVTRQISTGAAGGDITINNNVLNNGTSLNSLTLNAGTGVID